MLTVSVVIPTYQRRESVGRLLEHFRRQTLPVREYEVIVSIDGSNDGTLEMVEQFSSPYTLRGLWRQHRGRAAACNTGIRDARGEIVVLLDDDMMPTPDFLAAHADAHADRARIGVVGAAPIDTQEPIAPVAAYIADKFNRHLMKLSEPDYTFKLRDFYSGNFSIRRALLMEVDLFDEAFTVYGNEDLELGWRMSRAGIRIIYSAQALAHQRYEKTFSELARDTVAKGRTAVLLASKHPGVSADLKLATLRQASLRWRTTRSALVTLSTLVPSTARCVTMLVALMERRRLRGLHRLFDLALDYFYWLGVRQALRDSLLRPLRGRIAKTNTSGGAAQWGRSNAGSKS